MKRMLLTLTAAILLLNALALPSVARADGGGTGGTNCGGNQVCKP